VKTQVWVQVWWQIAAIALSSNVAILAQIVPDQTLPVGQRSQVSGTLNTEINGGAVRGSNLFHSFQQFSIPTGGSAFFNNGSTITNIISRVTGSSISNIDGLIRVNGNANLFLINPNGILFGPNAQLNVGGSFIASTANSFVFDNGFAFSTTDPQAPPLLTVNVPIGLQFGSNLGMIKSQGASLQVSNGQTLTLVGGAVNVDGGQLLAPGGRVELGGVSASGTVGLNREGSLSFPDEVARADISLTNAAKVDVRADGGGSITVNARNLEVSEGSQLLAGIRKGMGTPKAQAGDITINATNSVQFDGEDQDGSDSGAFSTVESGAEGNSGSVSINTRFLEVRKGALLDASTFGRGNAGSVTINATERVRFDGAGIDGLESGARSEVVFDAGTAAVGTAGGVSITTRILEALNGAQISTSTNGIGNGGRVVINAADLARFDGEDEQGDPSGAFSNVNRRAIGNAGGVFITTGSLEVTNGAVISASTFGTGNAGGITINATDSVRFDGVDGEGNSSSNASSQVNSRGVGNAGGVSIATRSLEVTNGAQISASIFGIGNTSGGITINATDLVRFSGDAENGVSSGAFSSVQFSNIRNAPGEGNAGGISITTGSLELLNGALLDASTEGIGNAGDITITARDRVFFSGRGTFASGAYSSVESRAIGRGGNINITTKSLSLTNGGIVSANTFSQGNAGNITIRASDLVFFDGIGTTGDPSGAFSSVEARAVGQGGKITVNTGLLSITNRAELSASSEGQGNAGNLEVFARQLRLDNQGSIKAQTASGQGGNITLQVQDLLLLRRGSFISTTAGTAQAGGDGGNINFNGNFIVAVPNEDSDISANAFSGRGGKVEITAQGIFGIQPRPEPTSLSDITASSAFGISGTVTLNTPKGAALLK
jgi:filamentous hemagglutinin family protein